MNKKSLKTQHQIENALFSLLKKHPYNSLNVSQITKHAGVSRMAFYRNYEQKDQILITFLRDQYQKFIDDLSDHKLTDFKDQLAVYFNFFKDHPDLMKLFLNAGLEGELLNQQTKFLKELINYSHPNLKLPSYAISYQSGGIYMLLIWWIGHNYQKPVSELLSYIENHIVINS